MAEEAGTRDKLIHDYLGVDYELVWDIVQNKIPGVEKAMAGVPIDFPHRL
jgi:uncharacterized protein with HEPN domain